MAQLPDPEIKELKELVQKDIEIGNETRKMVADMRRHARWGMVFQVFYWMLILGVLGAAYYYISPYVSEVFGFYRQVQESSTESGGFVQSLFDTVGKYVSSSTRR